MFWMRLIRELLISMAPPCLPTSASKTLNLIRWSLETENDPESYDGLDAAEFFLAIDGLSFDEVTLLVLGDYPA